MKSTSILLLMAILIFLAGCGQPAPVTPTVSVIPTLPLISRSVTPATPATPIVATQTLAAALPATQVATQPPATATKPAAAATVPAARPTTPPATPTTAPGFPQKPEAILIQAPGPASFILSPVTISGQADSTFEQNLVVKVVGENGLMIASKATTIQAEMGKRGNFSVSLPFSTAKEQPGRVAVYDTSPKDGGLLHFSSVEVTLKPNGSASLQPGKPQNEILVITQPAPATAASGGKLHVEGWSGPVFENALVVILCGEGGSGKSDPFCGTADNVMVKTGTTIHAPDAGQPGTFSLDLAYKVTKPTSGRVAVYFTSARDGGLLHLTSVPVQLKP